MVSYRIVRFRRGSPLTLTDYSYDDPSRVGNVLSIEANTLCCPYTIFSGGHCLHCWCCHEQLSEECVG